MIKQLSKTNHNQSTNYQKETIVVVHCGTGVKAEMAYNLLKEGGYDNIRFLNANVRINKDSTYEITKEEE